MQKINIRKSAVGVHVQEACYLHVEDFVTKRCSRRAADKLEFINNSLASSVGDQFYHWSDYVGIADQIILSLRQLTYAKAKPKNSNK